MIVKSYTIQQEHDTKFASLACNFNALTNLKCQCYAFNTWALCFHDGKYPITCIDNKNMIAHNAQACTYFDNNFSMENLKKK